MYLVNIFLANAIATTLTPKPPPPPPPPLKVEPLFLVKPVSLIQKVTELRLGTGIKDYKSGILAEGIKEKIIKSGTTIISSSDEDLFFELDNAVILAFTRAKDVIKRVDYEYTLLSVFKLLKEALMINLEKSKTSASRSFLQKMVRVLNFQDKLIDVYKLEPKYASLTLLSLLSMTRTIKENLLIDIARQVFNEEGFYKDFKVSHNSPSYFTNLMGDYLLSTFQKADYRFSPGSFEKDHFFFEHYGKGFDYYYLATDFEGIAEVADYRVALIKDLTDIVKEDETSEEVLEFWRDSATILLSSIVYEQLKDKKKPRETLWEMLPYGDRTVFYAGYHLESGSHSMIVEVVRRTADSFDVRVFNPSPNLIISPSNPGYIGVRFRAKEGAPLSTTYLTINMMVNEDKTLVPDSRQLGSILKTVPNSYLKEENVRVLPFVDLKVRGSKSLQECQFFDLESDTLTYNEAFQKFYPDIKDFAPEIKAPLYLFQKPQQSGTCSASSYWMYLRSRGVDGMNMEIKLRMRIVKRLLKILKLLTEITEAKPNFLKNMLDLFTKRLALRDHYSVDGPAKEPKFPIPKIKNIYNDYSKGQAMLMRQNGLEPFMEPFISMPFFFKALANGSIHELYEWIMRVTTFDKEIGKELWTAFESEKVEAEKGLLDYDFDELKHQFNENVARPAQVIEFANNPPEIYLNPEERSEILETESADEEEGEEEENEEDEDQEEGETEKAEETGKESGAEVEKEAQAQKKESYSDLLDKKKYEHSEEQRKLLSKIEEVCLVDNTEDQGFVSSCFPLLYEAVEGFNFDDRDLATLNLKIKSHFEKKKDSIERYACKLLYQKLFPYSRFYKHEFFYLPVLEEISRSCTSPQIKAKKDFTDKTREECRKLDPFDFSNAKQVLFCNYLREVLKLV